MPELPEVETMRRGLEPVRGGMIASIELPDIPYRPILIDPPIDEFRDRAIGKTILAIDRIGKRVLVRLNSGDSIVMQPKMAGIAMLSDPPSAAHTRMIVSVTGAEAPRFLYWDRRGLGNVCLWTPEQVHEKLGPSVLGPDASIVAVNEFVARFKTIDRPVKVALLDQRIVAGIGNLYAAEILHAARVHPELKCSEISVHAWKRIHAATIEILQRAILNEGSTLSDGTYRNAINGEGSYQNHHRVYDRENLQCLQCNKAEIIRFVQAQRSTFFCPRCQRR